MRVKGVRLVGERAMAALGATGGRALVISPLTGSSYLQAGEQVIWLGAVEGMRHPRAVLAQATPLLAAGVAIDIDLTGARPWRTPGLRATAGGTAALRAGAERLARELAAREVPRGFATPLAGERLPSPLDGATGRAQALADACLADDPDAAAAAAIALLGLGPGLTPAGDDYVGGVFFARTVLATLGACDRGRWQQAAAQVRAATRGRTHPVSAALLGDLLDGAGWAPLHDLVAALADGDAAAALHDARALTGLGHTSGWDILAGLLAGLR